MLTPDLYKMLYHVANCTCKSRMYLLIIIKHPRAYSSCSYVSCVPIAITSLFLIENNNYARQSEYVPCSVVVMQIFLIQSVDNFFFFFTFRSERKSYRFYPSRQTNVFGWIERISLRYNTKLSYLLLIFSFF